MISRNKFYEKHDIMKVLFLREINRFLSQILSPNLSPILGPILGPVHGPVHVLYYASAAPTELAVKVSDILLTEQR